MFIKLFNQRLKNLFLQRSRFVFVGNTEIRGQAGCLEMLPQKLCAECVCGEDIGTRQAGKLHAKPPGMRVFQKLCCEGIRNFLPHFRSRSLCKGDD